MMKRFLAGLLAALLAVSLLAAFPRAASAEELRNVEINRFNVVLVVDKSGSLHWDTDGKQFGWGTDDNDLRFDAIKLFLALLTESGNNVGAVMFDSEVKDDYIVSIRAMNGQSDKDALVSRIQAKKVDGDTNIGLALDKATDMLLEQQQENDLPCIILLLTDGRTDFTFGTVPSVTDAIRDARALGESAAARARSNGIRIYGIMLGDGTTVDTRALDEMATYTSEYDSVTTADELTRAFRTFYNIINSAEYTGVETESFDETGYIQTTFEVPSYGLEEVNIVIEHPANGKKLLRDSIEITVKKPDGSSFATTGHRVDTAHYIIVKVPKADLVMDEWTVELKGNPGDTVDVSKIFNSSLSLSLSCGGDPDELVVNQPQQFTLAVKDAYLPRLREVDLKTLTAELHIEDKTTGEERVEEMAVAPEAGGYTYELSFEEEARCEVYAKISTRGGYEVNSNTLTANIVAPPPESTMDEPLTGTMKFSFFSPTTAAISFENLFTDPKGTALSYALSDDFGGRVSLDGETVVVARSGMRVDAEEVKATFKDMKLLKETLRFELLASDSYPYGSKSCAHPVVITVFDSRLLTLIVAALVVLAVIALLLARAFVRSKYPCKLQVTITATDNGRQAKLVPAYNFRGRRSLKKLGLKTAGRYWLEATTDPTVCLFRGTAPFVVKGQARPVKAERISGGLPKTITLKNGVELNIAAMTMRF